MAELNGLRIAVLKRTATAKITGVVRGFQYQSEFTIPTQVEEKGMTFRVTEIDDAAFRKCSALTSITIPEGIVRIGKLAFAECSSLTSITIPKSVTQIESGSVKIGDTYYSGHLFTHCPSLTSIVVEEGNPRYSSIQNGNGIIDKTTNTLIAGDQTTIIPNSVTSIGIWAFGYWSSLTSINIPNSVTSIGESAFRNCGVLTSINVDVNNPNYCSIDGVLFDKSQTTLIKYPDGKQGAYTIPNSVRSIGDWAFIGCDKLTSITIPNSVTSIGYDAFWACSSLTSVTIENEEGKVAIGRDAFPSKAKINYVGKPKDNKDKKAVHSPQTTTKPEAKRPNENDMNLLDRLIESALEDFIVTDEERRTLLKKAEEIGLSDDEFKLYINGKIQERMKDKPQEKAEEKKKGFFARLFGK